MADSKMLVFGPQVLSFNAISFKALRTRLHSDDLHEWALEALTTLPATLAAFSTEASNSNLGEAQNALEALVNALRTGDVPSTLFPLPNVLLSPLVVVSQLVDYIAAIQAIAPGLEKTAPLPASITASAETLGLCTGILSAFAVSSAASLAELQQYGAASVRLAMLSGAIVDAEDASRPSEKKSASISASWAAATSADLDAVLQKYPDVSVPSRNFGFRNDKTNDRLGIRLSAGGREKSHNHFRTRRHRFATKVPEGRWYYRLSRGSWRAIPLACPPECL